MGNRRVLDDKLNNLLEMFPVVAIVGPRQCGKTTLVQQLRPEWRYYDLEGPDDYQLISSDPLAFFSLNSDAVIIDEAQQYPELFKVLRGVVDQDRNSRGRFILTGSSSPAISRGITESLAGRIATVEMWPFKQGEFLEQPLSAFYSLIADNKGIDSLSSLSPQATMNQTMEVWFKGGFPEPLIQSGHDNDYYKFWMENYIKDYVGRDIRALFPRLNIHNFRRFLLLLAQFSGHQLNMSNIARSLEISVSTVKDYLDIIHQTFIWRNLPPFEKNSLRRRNFSLVKGKTPKTDSRQS